VQRLYDFLRRHPTGVDVFWAVLLFGVSLASETARGESRGTESPMAIVPIALLLCLVVALRRRMPERMLLLAVGLGVAQLVLDVETTPADFAFLACSGAVSMTYAAPSA
jgi:hypothetical protein